MGVLRRFYNRLTDLFVRKARPGRRYADGNGLYLSVRKSGSRSWVQRLVIQGRRRDLGLGGYPLVSLAGARGRAAENRQIARAGGDPTKDGKETTTPVVRVVAEKVIEARRASWRDPSTERKWRRMFDCYVFPLIGDVPIGLVTLEQIRDIIVPIWHGRGSLGYVLRQHLDHVFEWSMAKGYRSDNPAAKLKVLLPKVKTVVRHHASLPYRQVPEAVAAIRAADADPAVKLLLVFIILTASRFGEAVGALWSEIDLPDNLWVLPPDRMKAGNEHRVPLALQVRAVLAEARALNRSDLLVFATVSGGRIPRSALSRLLNSLSLPRDRGRRIVVHGFRSSFRVFAGEEAKAHPEVCEAALAHLPPNMTVRAYARSDYLEDRRGLMQVWADYVLAAIGN